MIKKVGKETYNVYAMDFETHADTETIEAFKKGLEVDTGVWLWYLINEKDDYLDNCYGYTLEGFFNRLMKLAQKEKHTHKNNNVLVYDYNLAFEWSFIRFWLGEKGFEYREKFSSGDKFCYNLVCTPSQSRVWEINICFDYDNFGIVKMRDLNLILNCGSLSKVAKAFGLKTQKGEIDYTKNRRDINYVVTDEEKFYCYKDVKIIMDILTSDKIINDKEFWKSLSSSTYSCMKAINFAYSKYYKPYQQYRKNYPELGAKEFNFVHNSVGGGITYCVPRYQFRDIVKGDIVNGQLCEGILHIDMKQAHPSQMATKYFPRGNGKYLQFAKNTYLKNDFNGELIPNKIACIHCYVSYTSVKLHSVIPLIGLDYYVYKHELTLWDFEIATMFKAYNNLEIELIDCYYYNKSKLPFADYFKENFKNREIAKDNNDEYHKAYYKLLSNGVYGKLLEGGHNHIIIPDLGSVTGEYAKIIINEEDKRYKIQGKYSALYVGSCVSAYTRCWLIETALKFDYRNILYFDTDSIFMLYNETTKEEYKNLPMERNLYNWGLEEISEKAQFTAPKRYKLKVDSGNTVIKSSGFNISGDYETTDIINNKIEVLQHFRVKGGTLLVPKEKEIKVQEKYKMIFDNVEI